MNLIEKIKNAVKHSFIGKKVFLLSDTSEDHETTIKKLTDYLNIPSQSFFKADKEMYNAIDRYKNKYRNNLNKDNYREKLRKPEIQFSWELGNNDLKRRREMLVFLIKKNFIDEIDSVTEEENPIKKMVMLKKFELYMNDVMSIIKDTMSRLVALAEIQNEDILTQRKKDILNYEIENLSVSIISLINQIDAIKYETQAYQDTLKKMIKNGIEEPNENTNVSTNKVERQGQKAISDYQSIEEMYKSLAESVKAYIDVHDIDNLDGNYYLRMAMLEKRLEEFFYTHPNFINNYIEEFKKIKVDAINVLESDNYLIHIMRMKDIHDKSLTDRIMAIDEQFKIFEKYGAHLDRAFLEEYYKTKMRIIVYDNMDTCGDFETSILAKDGDFAINVYKKEIEKKIDEIKKGQVSYLDLYDSNISEYIGNLIKNINGSYDSDAILTNNYLLTLLFALNVDTFSSCLDGFISSFISDTFLNKWLDSKVPYRDFLDEKICNEFFNEESGIIYDPNLPIRTICEVMRAQKNFNSYFSENAKAISSLVQLYLKINPRLISIKYKDDDIYYIPEGIIQIGDSSDNSSRNDYLSFLKQRKYSQVRMPQSLKKFYGNEAINDLLSYLEFSNGTEEINFDCYRIMYIIIPPSVKDINIDFKSITYGGFPPYCYHRRLIFLDYEKSSFLNPQSDKDITNANNFLNSIPKEVWIELHSINGDIKAIHGRDQIEERTKKGIIKSSTLYNGDQNIPITDKIVLRKKDSSTSSRREEEFKQQD